MTAKVLVLGLQSGEPPPGLPESDTGVEYVITAAPDVARDALRGTEIVFQYGAPKETLREIWGAAGDVRWIHVGGVGVDFVLSEALVASDVTLTNSRGVFDVTLPEYLLSLMLALAKDLPTTIRSETQRTWRHRWLEPIAGGRAVILGAGSIARGAARLLTAVGLEVTLVGRQARTQDGWAVRGISDLPELLPEADWLVSLLPLTGSTRRLIGARELSLLPRRARVVNIGRGPVFVEDDLVDALQRGVIRAAALDVFEVEPLPAGSPLWEMPNVLISPHIGGDVVDTGSTLTAAFLSNLRRYLTGEPLENVVDKRLGYVPASR